MSGESNDRSVELKITEEAKNADDSALKRYIDKLQDEGQPKEERYHAYLVLFVYHRRHKNIRECIQLYNDYKDFFGDQFLILHFYAIVLKETGAHADLEKAVSLARKAVSLEPENPGALNNLAGGLASLADSSYFEKKQRNRMLVEGLEAVNKAIRLEPSYAKYYGTKARLESLLGRQNEAEESVAFAIALEDSQSKDYPIRITEYLQIRMSIQTNKTAERVLTEAKGEIQTVAQEARRSNLEILSFFVVVVSFVIGSFSLAKGRTPAEAIQVILVLASSLLSAVSGFTLLFYDRHKWRRLTLSLAIAVLLFVVAIFVPAIFA